MHRGKALQTPQDCDYCGQPMPLIRHPKAKVCSTTCQQRARYARNNDKPGIKCLDCGKVFRRVGSHVVQVHGYENTAEYLKEHGLMAKETHTEEHAALMRSKVSQGAIESLKLGEPNRYRKGGDHGKKISEFWENRKKKKGYETIGTPLNHRNHI